MADKKRRASYGLGWNDFNRDLRFYHQKEVNNAGITHGAVDNFSNIMKNIQK